MALSKFLASTSVAVNPYVRFRQRMSNFKADIRGQAIPCNLQNHVDAKIFVS